MLEKLKNIFPNIRENEPLALHTTFRIGGPARYFLIIQSEDELKKVLEFVLEHDTPFYILGGGSNLLVSDKGFNGLVIKMNTQNFSFEETSNPEERILKAQAGILLSKLVIESTKSSLSGLEWAFGIPGTLGGALNGNAGAYGHSIGEFCQEVKVLDVDFQEKKIKTRLFTQADCGFSYRSSVFKTNPHLVITEASLKLTISDLETIQNKIDEIRAQRQKKIPPYPSAGSVFKNKKIYQQDGQIYFSNGEPLPEKIQNILPKEFLEKGAIPAAWLIDECGLKGKKIGQAQVALEHANFIINTGQAKAEDVIMLISFIKQQVRDRLGIQLEEEIQYLGF